VGTPQEPAAATRWDFFPWRFRRDATEAERAAQQQLHQRLAADGAELADDCFIAPSAAIEVGQLAVGERAYIAAHAYVSGQVSLGADSTMNPFTVVRGAVRIGRAVRIGAHTSLLGFNHSFAELDRDMFRQPHTSEGIVIEDDVWIGSQVTILDGVKVGAHSIIGAGSVVTKDVAAWSIVAGNPARLIRDRRSASRAAASTGTSSELGRRLTEFQQKVRRQVPVILERSFDPDLGTAGMYRDPAALGVTVRAHCDAVEIADLILQTAPAELSAEEHVARLQSWQSASSGLVAEVDPSGEQTEEAKGFGEYGADYHVLCVGYALDVLGGEFPHPIIAAQDLSPADLVHALGALDWRHRAWSAGSFADTVGTAIRWNAGRGAAHQPGMVEALFGWLTLNADPVTGLWGAPGASDGFLQPVNGFYRASRGTFAQFDVGVPHPEAVVDTVLRHAKDARFFGTGVENACNVLDLVHPLWLMRRQTTHRADEAKALARTFVDFILGQWVDERGFAFAPSRTATDSTPRTTPGLQGTEMWLAVLWLAADLCGLTDAMSYRPRGVHRPEPALSLRTPLG
jgi:acetyltransferase-like isoleucine patch superfamily enzyme